MARRTFDVIDLIEVFEHWWAGRSQVQISESLGIDRKTVRKYLTPAEAAGIVPGQDPALSVEDWRERIQEWFPQIADAALRQITWPAIAVHRDYIMEQLKEGVTQATIHQRLVDERGLVASYSSMRRWVAGNLPEEARRARVTSWRPPVPAGSEAQIDYGKLGSWMQPAGGRRVTIWAFVMVLACSRFMFVRPVIRMDQETWTRAHVEAFTFFDGVPARLVPDNLKTGVDRPDLYDPKLNRSFAEMAAHYATLIDPARAHKPKDKPRVERAMPYVRDSFWRGRDFGSLEQMQAAALVWCRDVAGQRSHRSLDGAAPAVVFTAMEAQALIALPRTPFTLATWSTAKVGPDIHIKAGPALYSVPWKLMGERVDVRTTATSVQILHEGAVAATHIRAERGRRTNTEHYPPEKIAFYQRTPIWCRRTATEVGPACTQVIAVLLAENALYRLRSAQGILRLRDTYGPARLEAACETALTAGDPSYRTIKGLLAAGLDTVAATTRAEQARTAAAAAVPAFLRGQGALFDVPDPSPVPTPAVVHLPTTSSSTAQTGTTSSSEGTTSPQASADPPLSQRTSSERRIPAPRIPVFSMATDTEDQP
jgi:transposase